MNFAAVCSYYHFPQILKFTFIGSFLWHLSRQVIAQISFLVALFTFVCLGLLPSSWICTASKLFGKQKQHQMDSGSKTKGVLWKVHLVVRNFTDKPCVTKEIMGRLSSKVAQIFASKTRTTFLLAKVFIFSMF